MEGEVELHEVFEDGDGDASDRALRDAREQEAADFAEKAGGETGEPVGENQSERQGDHACNSAVGGIARKPVDGVFEQQGRINTDEDRGEQEDDHQANFRARAAVADRPQEGCKACEDGTVALDTAFVLQQGGCIFVGSGAGRGSGGGHAFSIASVRITHNALGEARKSKDDFRRERGQRQGRGIEMGIGIGAGNRDGDGNGNGNGNRDGSEKRGISVARAVGND